MMNAMREIHIILLTLVLHVNEKTKPEFRLHQIDISHHHLKRLVDEMA